MPITIPATTDELRSSLDGLGKLLTAKQWERAAIVYAWTSDDTPQGPRRSVARTSHTRLSFREFSELGIAGLRSKDTVALYHRTWRDNGGDTSIERGSVVAQLPTADWPPTRTGTDGHSSADGATRTTRRIIERHGVAAVVEALTEDERADVVREIARRAPLPEQLDDRAHERMRADLGPEAANAWARVDALGEGARILETLVRYVDAIGRAQWDRAGRVELSAQLDRIAQHLDVARALVEGASDEQLARLLGGAS